MTRQKRFVLIAVLMAVLVCGAGVATASGMWTARDLISKPSAVQDAYAQGVRDALFYVMALLTQGTLDQVKYTIVQAAIPLGSDTTRAKILSDIRKRDGKEYAVMSVIQQASEELSK